MMAAEHSSPAPASCVIGQGGDQEKIIIEMRAPEAPEKAPQGDLEIVDSSPVLSNATSIPADDTVATRGGAVVLRDILLRAAAEPPESEKEWIVFGFSSEVVEAPLPPSACRAVTFPSRAGRIRGEPRHHKDEWLHNRGSHGDPLLCHPSGMDHQRRTGKQSLIILLLCQDPPLPHTHLLRDCAVHHTKMVT